MSFERLEPRHVGRLGLSTAEEREREEQRLILAQMQRVMGPLVDPRLPAQEGR